MVIVLDPPGPVRMPVEVEEEVALGAEQEPVLRTVEVDDRHVDAEEAADDVGAVHGHTEDDTQDADGAGEDDRTVAAEPWKNQLKQSCPRFEKP